MSLPFLARCRRISAAPGLLFALAALAPAASAISMRDDVPNVGSTLNDNPYVSLGSTYDAVVFIQWTTPSGSFVGTGTLVPSSIPGQYTILTAAHNIDSEGGPGSGGNRPNGIADATSYTVYFGARTGADGSSATSSVTIPAANISVQPNWFPGGNGLATAASQYDLAVMRFSLGMVTGGALPAPMGLSLGNAQGLTGTMVGYGNFGLGSTFANMSADGVRRAGQNVINVFGTAADNPANTGFTLQTDFDSPHSAAASTLGSSNPLALEASTAGGDSGGPLVVTINGQRLVVGVLNGGFPGTGGNLSEYGDRSIWAGFTDSDNLAFLMGAGVAVPEPSAVALAAIGLASLGGALRWRRRSAC